MSEEPLIANPSVGAIDSRPHPNPPLTKGREPDFCFPPCQEKTEPDSCLPPYQGGTEGGQESSATNNQFSLTQPMRWKIILENTGSNFGQGASESWQRRAEALSFLYDREYRSRNVRSDAGSSREGGLENSQLTIPDWINAIHELFPKKTIERLERDALERYHLEEMVTNPELLGRAEPSPTLLKAVLRTKHLMNQAVLAIARQLVQKVIDQLIEKLAREVQSPFLGTVDRSKRSYLKIAKNFDPTATIRNNLSSYDPDTKRLYIKTPHFYSRIRRNLDRWQLLILVDESGSMVDSVIHAAVTASIFYQLKQIRTHLCIFDTSIVDLTEQCTDPVETLMQVQLGGGTNIGQALNYAETLVENPRNTIVVLITDFYEGAPTENLYRTTQRLVESGVTILGLAALDSEANPNYDRTIAQQLVNLGMQVGAMTPGELAEWVAQKVKK